MTADAALVRRCLAGDATASSELVARFQNEIFAVCMRLLHHRHDAEDVVQEVFLRVFRSLKRWDETRPLRPWILAIAINRCRTQMSLRGKRPEAVEYLHETPDLRPVDDSNEISAGLWAIVDELRAEYRIAFILFHEQGRSYEEIAVALERPAGTIKTWLHRARLELFDKMRARGLIPEDVQT